MRRRGSVCVPFRAQSSTGLSVRVCGANSVVSAADGASPKAQLYLTAISKTRHSTYKSFYIKNMTTRKRVVMFFNTVHRRL